MKSIESNVSKLERMTPVFSRELMAFVSGNKSELYEKRRKRNVAEAVVAKRGKEEDFRQPTSQFLSVFSVGSRNSSGSENMVLSLTDESCIRPSELAKKHFPAVMNAMREVNGMNVRVVALRPRYRYEEKKKEKKKKTRKRTKNQPDEQREARSGRFARFITCPATARTTMTSSGPAVRTTRLEKKPTSTMHPKGMAVGRSIWKTELRKLSTIR